MNLNLWFLFLRFILKKGKDKENVSFHKSWFTPSVAVGAEPDSVEARSPERHPVLHVGGRDPRTWAIFCLLEHIHRHSNQKKQGYQSPSWGL